MKISVVLLGCVSILALASCGGSSNKIEQPAGLKSTMDGGVVDIDTDYVTYKKYTGVEAVDENNGVYALKADGFSHNGEKIFPHGVFYNGEGFLMVPSSSLGYIAAAGDGEDMLSYSLSAPLSYDSRYEGIYSQTNIANGGQKTGGAVIDVNGSGQYLTVSGPSALEGKKHNWDWTEESYVYEGFSGNAPIFSMGVTNPDEAFVTYFAPSYHGLVYGVK